VLDDVVFRWLALYPANLDIGRPKIILSKRSGCDFFQQMP